MVLEWRPLANRQLKEIIDYYCKVAGVRVAQNIVKDIIRTVEQLLIFPNMGYIEQNLEEFPYTIRSIVANKHYKIIYYLSEDIIHIFSIWDVRQDPQKIKTLF